MTDELEQEEPFDPDDFEAMEEMHQQMKEMLAADNVLAWVETEPVRVRDLLAALFAFNRAAAESIDSIAMIVGRLQPENKGPEEVKQFRKMIATHLNTISEGMRKFTVPMDEEEE